jgi:hypothetical protein
VTFSALNKEFESSRIEGVQKEHATSGEQGAIQGKRWIFCGSAYERDSAILNKWEEGVLLRAIEPMYLVAEQDCPTPNGSSFFRSLKKLS